MDEGAIGEVFHIELSIGSFGKFEHGWYSQKKLSGGAFYFWGPHAVDWALDLVGEPIAGVNGYFHKLLWPEVDMADQVRAIIRFEGGAVADVCHSHIAAHSKPLWRILGTRGAIVDTGPDAHPRGRERAEPHNRGSAIPRLRLVQLLAGYGRPPAAGGADSGVGRVRAAGHRRFRGRGTLFSQRPDRDRAL